MDNATKKKLSVKEAQMQGRYETKSYKEAKEEQEKERALDAVTPSAGEIRQSEKVVGELSKPTNTFKERHDMFTDAVAMRFGTEKATSADKAGVAKALEIQKNWGGSAKETRDSKLTGAMGGKTYKEYMENGDLSAFDDIDTEELSPLDRVLVNNARLKKATSVASQKETRFEIDVNKRVKELRGVKPENYVYSNRGNDESLFDWQDEVEAEALKRAYNDDELNIAAENVYKNNGGRFNSVFDPMKNSVASAAFWLAEKLGGLTEEEKEKGTEIMTGEAKRNATKIEGTARAINKARDLRWEDRTAEMRESDDWQEKSKLSRSDKDELKRKYATGANQYAHTILGGDTERRFIANTFDIPASDTKWLSDEEVENLIYIAHTDGKDAGNAYYKTIIKDANKKRAEKKAEETEKYAKEHPWLANIKMGAEAVAQGVGDAATAISDTVGVFTNKEYETYDENDPRFDFDRDREIITAVTKEKIDNPVLEGAYDIGMSVWENVARTGTATALGAAVGGAPGAAVGAKLSTVLMGTRAYQSGVYDATKRGASKESAMIYGLFSGGVEFMTEQIGIDNLLGIVDDAFKHGGKAVLKNIGKQMAAEGAEEFLAAVAEPIYDDMVMGEKSHFNIRVKELEASGATHTEARRQTMLEKGSEVLMSAFAGAVSGGIMGGGGTAIGAIGNYAGNRAKNNGNAENVAGNVSDTPSVSGADSSLEEGVYKEAEDVADNNDGNIEAVGVDGTIHQNGAEEQSSTSSVKRATDIVVSKLSDGEWSAEHEGVYNNAVRDLEATMASSEDENVRNSIQSEINRLQKVRALKTAKTADDVLRAYIPTAEVMTADEAVKLADAELRAINAAEPKGKDILSNEKQDWKERKKQAVQKLSDIRFAKALADEGFHVKFFSVAEGTDGKMAPDGATVGKDIYININGVDAVKKTLGHEFVHVLKNTSPEAYADFAKVVEEQFDKKFARQVEADYESRYEGVYESFDKNAKLEEYAADVAGDMLINPEYSRSLIDAIMQGEEAVEVKKSKIKAIAEAVRGVIIKLNTALRKMRGTYEYGKALQYINDAKAVHQALVKAYHEVGNKKTATGADEVKYSATDGEEQSIKDQIRANLDVLNSMEPVANIAMHRMGKKTKVQILSEVLQDIKSKGMVIDKKGFGVISLTEDDINRGLDYVNNDAEYSAYFAIHRVLKRGTVIGEHIDHKNRNMRTVTIGAPIILDEQRCNVGITLKAIKGYRYKSLRVVLWDGSKVDTKKETKATTSRMTDVFTGESRDITLASKDSLSQDTNAVKGDKLSGGEVKFSFAGHKAETADMSAFERAENMEQNDASAEEILRETGWYRGIDGKWRFEISDEDVEFSRRGDLEFKKAHPDYARYRELLELQENYMLGLPGGRELTAEEQTEYSGLREIWKDVFRENGKVGEGAGVQRRLAAYFNHDKLYEAYPELRDAELVFDESIKRSYFSLKTNKITLAEKENTEEYKKSLVHEIQHWIQSKEGFASGASEEYWEDWDNVKFREERKRVSEITAELSELYKKAEPLYEDIGYKAYREMLLDKEERGEITLEDYEILTDEYVKEKSPELYALRQRILQLNKEYPQLTLRERRAKDLYYNTAGEIEARDASTRIGMTEAERRGSLPNRGDKNTVFADYSDYKLDEIEENKKTAEEAVDSGAQNDIIESKDYIEEGERYASRNITGRADGISVEDRDKAGRSDANTEDVSVRRTTISREENDRGRDAEGEKSSRSNGGGVAIPTYDTDETETTTWKETYSRRYEEALTKGDKQTARKALDEYAFAMGYEPAFLYHGTDSDEPFIAFENYGAAIWVSTKEEYSQKFATEYIGESPLAEQLFTTRDSGIYLLYAKKGHILDVGNIDVEIQTPQDMIKFAEKIGFTKAEIMKCWNAGRVQEYHSVWTITVTPEFAEFARQHGYDSLRATEGGGVETFGVLYPENLKSAKLETFDDDGNLIPLKKRFDDSTDDIRFSMPAPKSQAQYEDRVYKLKKDIVASVSERLGKGISSDSEIAIEELAEAIARGDETRTKALKEKLRDSILKNDMVYYGEIKHEDAVLEEYFKSMRRQKSKVLVEKEDSQDLTARELSSIFGVGGWSRTEGLGVDVMYEELVSMGANMPEADSVQDRLIAIKEAKERSRQVEKVPMLTNGNVAELIADAERSAVNAISEVERAREVTFTSTRDVEGTVPYEGKPISNANVTATVTRLNEMFEAIEAETNDIQKIGLEDAYREEQLKFFEWILPHFTKANERGVTGDYCFHTNAELDAERAEVAESQKAAREADEYMNTNQMTRNMVMAAHLLSEDELTEAELGEKWRNAEDRDKIRQLAEMYKKVTASPEKLKRRHKKLFNDVLKHLLYYSNQMRDIRVVNAQTDTPERIVDKVTRINQLRGMGKHGVTGDKTDNYFILLNDTLKDILIRGKDSNEAELKRAAERYRQIVKNLGIRAGSEDSALVQDYGEGRINELDIPFDKRKSVVDAARVLTEEVYKPLLEEANRRRFIEGTGEFVAPPLKLTESERRSFRYMLDNARWVQEHLAEVKAKIKAVGVAEAAKSFNLNEGVVQAVSDHGEQFARYVKWTECKWIAEDRVPILQQAWNLVQRGKKYNLRSGNVEMDYFPHFEKDDAIVELGNLFIDQLPTAINGLTESFRPNSKYNPYFNARTGNKTDSDAIFGADAYINATLQYVYHTSDITKARMAENHIREKYSKDGNNPYALSNFVFWLREWANQMAGKQHSIDRMAQNLIGRRASKAWRKGMGNIGRNQISWNMRTPLSNFSVWTRGLAVIAQELASEGGSSGLSYVLGGWSEHINKSDFLYSRFYDNVDLSAKDASKSVLGNGFKTGARNAALNVINTASNAGKKVSDAGFKLMGLSDKFTITAMHKMLTGVYIAQGMSEEDAIRKADYEMKSQAASRDFGDAPLIFSSQALRPFTMFQVEALNQIAYSKDVIAKVVKNPKTAKYILATIAGLALEALLVSLFNDLMKTLTGSPVMLDPIGITYESINSMKNGAGIDEVALDVMEEIPIVNNVLKATKGEMSEMIGIGAVVSILNNFVALWSDEEINWGELLYNAGLLVNPFGGMAQARKTYQAIQLVGDSYSENSKGQVRYAVDGDARDIIFGLLFGKSAMPSVQEWWDSGYKSLNKKNSNAFKQVLDLYKVKPEEAFDMMMEFQQIVSEAKENDESYSSYEWVTEELDKWGDRKWSNYDKYFISCLIDGREATIPARMEWPEKIIAEMFIRTGDNDYLMQTAPETFDVKGTGIKTVYTMNEAQQELYQDKYQEILFREISAWEAGKGFDGIWNEEQWKDNISKSKAVAREAAAIYCAERGYYDSKHDEEIPPETDTFESLKNNEKLTDEERFKYYLKKEAKDHIVYDEKYDAGWNLMRDTFLVEGDTAVLPTKKDRSFGNDKKLYTLNDEQYAKFVEYYNEAFYERLAGMKNYTYEQIISGMSKLKTAATNEAKGRIMDEYEGEILVTDKK